MRGSGSFFGYAYTFNEIQRHLKQYRVGGKPLQIDINNPKSRIQLDYGQPPGRFFTHQYKIQMTQWEATRVPAHWVDLAKGYNEWWTANHFGAQAMIDTGIPESKVHVFEHGIDSGIWSPMLRGQRDKIRFLHIDSASPRKRADLVVKAFKNVFGNNPDYELTLKYSHGPMSKANWDNESVLANEGERDGNIRKIRDNLSLEDLVKLYHFHDIVIYPSEGEGFGLIPLQALSTGMPVISTGRWCSYERFLNGNIIESTIGKSEISENYERHGNVVVPNHESTEFLMRQVADDIENQSRVFFSQAPDVARDYNWQTLTNKTMDNLVSRVGLDMFRPTKAFFN